MPPARFRSRIDAWFIAILAGSAVLVVYAVTLAWRTGELPLAPAFAVVLLSGALPAWIVLTTRYDLADDWLLVRSGPFRWRIPIADITAVTPTRSPLSSPALSLDRLRIEYGAGRAVMISPADKDGFLRALEAGRTRAVRARLATRGR